MNVGHTPRRRFNTRLLGLTAALLLPLAVLAQGAVPSPHAIAMPRWFSNSLLDLKDEIPEAAREGKRVLLYFGQDGCPYWARR